MRPDLQVPSPKPGDSALFSDLKELIQRTTSKPAHASASSPRSGQFDMGRSQIFDISKDLEQNYDIPLARDLFSAPKTFSRVKRSLRSVLAAKSFVYGSSFFGEKKIYSDEFDFSREPLHPKKRRQIRFGLKSLVDFIIQMDVENLKTCLHQKDLNVENFVLHEKGSLDPRFKEDSLFGLMNRTNPSACKLIFEIIERIVSNLNFSQSMAEYLASEGAIESTKLVVSEALKRGPDLGSFLRGGPFASCAHVYRNTTSRFDFDSAYFIDTNKSNRDIRSPTYRRSFPRYEKNKRRFLGYCFKFQKLGKCDSDRCIYLHKCANCRSKSHGSYECYQEKTERRKKSFEEKKKSSDKN